MSRTKDTSRYTVCCMLAAILDSENAKPMATSHSGQISSTYQEQIKKCKEMIVTRDCTLHPKYGLLPPDYWDQLWIRHCVWEATSAVTAATDSAKKQQVKMTSTRVYTQRRIQEGRLLSSVRLRFWWHFLPQFAVGLGHYVGEPGASCNKC